MSSRFSRALSETVQRPWPVAVGLSLMGLSALVNRLANDYINTFPPANESLPDIIHALFQPMDFNLFVTAGEQVVMILIFTYLLFWDTENFPFSFILLGSFFLVRSGFLFCTILPAPFPRIDDTEIFKVGLVTFGTRDLFPSGHAGSLLVLGFLIQKDRWVRVTVFILAFLASLAVLLMHVHYTIDVFGALFIAYAVYVFLERHVAPWARQKRNRLGPNRPSKSSSP
jgi:hypothetical protein